MTYHTNQPSERTLARQNMLNRLVRLCTRVTNMTLEDCEAMNRHLDAFRDEVAARRKAEYEARLSEAE